MQAYDDLAAELRQRAAQLTGDTQFWIGLAGGPGSGKSTLADSLKKQLGELLTIIPLDGYHYYRSELDEMEDPEQAHARRGAPFTFNATKFVGDLIKARAAGEGAFPSFGHGVGDPVEEDILLSKGPQIVLVEGNYLLLDTEPWCQLRERVFDETWFLDVPVHECNRRVGARHVKTGQTEEQAQLRVATNDSINAELIAKVSPGNADRIIQIPSWTSGCIKTLYFIRHTQSEANLKGILASRKNFPLTEKGRQEAVLIASKFRTTARLDRIFSSPLTRAQQTALPMAEAFGLDVETDDRITEQDLGIFSGMTYAELDDRPDYMHECSKRWKWIPEGGGESYEMIAGRLAPFFESLESLEGDSILFVTHAVTLRMIKATLEQTLPDYPREIAKNGEIWKVRFAGPGKIHEVESIFLGTSEAAISRP